MSWFNTLKIAGAAGALWSTAGANVLAWLAAFAALGLLFYCCVRVLNIAQSAVTSGRNMTLTMSKLQVETVTSAVARKTPPSKKE